MATQIKNLEHLKEVLSEREDCAELVIKLNGGLRSTKVMSYDGETFYILNAIDDTEQELTETQLMDRHYTNVGYALQQGALFLED